MVKRSKTSRKVRRFRAAKSRPVPALPFIQHSFGGRVEFLGNKRIPTVLMTREVFSRMWHFVDIANDEVSWLGTVKITPHGDYLIEEVFLLEQMVSGAETELSTEGQAQLAQELINVRLDGVDVVNRLRFWGHSHVRMETCASGQDERQMEEFRANGCPWFIRGILNKLGRMEFTIFLWEAGLKIVDVPWSVYENVDRGIRGEIETEFADKVSRRVLSHSAPVGVGAPRLWGGLHTTLRPIIGGDDHDVLSEEGHDVG